MTLKLGMLSERRMCERAQYDGTCHLQIWWIFKRLGGYVIIEVRNHNVASDPTEVRYINTSIWQCYEAYELVGRLQAF